VRAFCANALAGHVVEGGSTITQQLVKNLFFSDAKRTMVRKVAEAIVAEQIEARYAKPDILSMYLNEIYFGNGAHGVEQAAQTYFGKTSAELSLSESAFLAAVIKAPSLNGSVEHRPETLVRQREILDAMAAYGYVTDVEAKCAKRAPLKFMLAADRKEEPPFTKYPYYVSYVLDLIHQHFDDNEIRRTGLRVYTNLDAAAQSCAEQLLARDIRVAPRGIDEEALVAISVKDGAVRAIVGGAGDYWSNQWNCATNPHTVGSAFKPFVYLTAFLQGALTPESVIDDKPLVVNQIDMTYAPKNYDNKFLGSITAREALSKSRNTCAVRVAQMVGAANIVEIAKKVGIESPLEPHLSLALGSCAVSPFELACAYGTFARGGILIKPWTVRHINDLSGNQLETYGPIACRVLPEQPVAQLVDVLEDVVTGGTGTLARLPDRPAAGKTGTADQARDLWFVGFTPDMVTAVWGGNKNNRPIADKHVTGGSVMARVWRDFNLSYYKRCPTPAGELIVTKGKEPSKDDSDKSLAGSSSAHRAARHGYSVPVQTSTSNPTAGMVVRNSKGVTDYAWQKP
jgi:penicillin-binding protein 1A